MAMSGIHGAFLLLGQIKDENSLIGEYHVLCIVGTLEDIRLM
jgi:hypothetical protein